MRARGWFLVMAGFGILTPAVAADWPQWRGPQRNGISQESGLLKQWPKQGPALLWQLTDVGDGYATPAVVGPRLYLLSNRGMDHEAVQALSVQDGKPVWSVRIGNVGNPNQEPPYPMARSTPTVDGDALYALGSDGDLACLDTATGKPRWQKSLRRDFGGKPGKWAYSESPLIDGDVLVVTPGGNEATLAALDKRTGAVIWKSAVPGGDAAAYSSAIAIEAGGRKQYVQFLDKGVVGVDAKTGQFLWRYERTSTGPANIPTPVADRGYVYSANARRFGGALVQLHATQDGVTAEEVYFERDVPNTLGGQVLLGAYLYGTNPKGMVAAEFLTGKIRWQAEGVGPGAVQYADGHFYVHGEHGDVALVEATPEAYREKGRFTPAEQPKRVRAREMAWAYPVVANGRLYIRDLGTLWCYDVKDSKAR
ncbi:MAG: PQQ-like beta-propeller repeat protein [Acidobacteria bacterium]|nr:PQQ-like beta-propeller repeat protein [Acidobacteriota bacterium]